MRSSLQSLGDAEAVRAELAAIAAGPARATVRDFATSLGRLSLHFWRPDFTPEQAKLLYGDFVHDLADCTAKEIDEACAEWRMDPLNRFFPTPGQLRELMQHALSERARRKNGAQVLLELMDNGVAKSPGHFDAGKQLKALAEKMRAR